jgi:hypothetical protein
LACTVKTVVSGIRCQCVLKPKCADSLNPSRTTIRGRYFAFGRFGALTSGVLLLFTSLVSGASIAGAIPGKWSIPVEIEGQLAAGGSLNLSDVACSSSSFCVAVDSLGAALFWHGSQWSAPHHVNANGSLDSVSCPSTTYCVVVSDAGKAVTYHGGAWSAPKTLGPEDSYSVSCPSVNFCAAVGANGLPGKPSTIATFNGHSWSSHLTTTSGSQSDRLLGVSCATATHCVAVNFDGQILTFNGKRWSPMLTVGPKGLISVSCPSNSFCLAVTISGVSIEIHATSWTNTTTIPKFQAALSYSVSCATSTTCVVTGLNGQTDKWRAGMWNTPVKVFTGGFNALVSTSCTRSGYCMVITSKGRSSFENQ